MKNFWELSKPERQELYQSKYEYYRWFNTCIIIFCCLSSVFYFMSDCQLFGRFAWETFIPRTFILFPMTIFLIVNKSIKNYKIMVPFSYLIIHGIMWCTIWAIVFLPDKTHAQEGFIIMQLLFIVVGFCAPFGYSTFFHSLLIFNIFFSNLFNHYERVDLMYSLGIPATIGIILTHFVMNKVYKDQFDTKRQLENLSTIDYLTKAYNRNILHKIIKKDSYKFITEMGDEITIMIVDIDFFKQINDAYGHDAGDIVLSKAASVIRSCIRSSDVFLRWGGEEFVVVMPESDLLSAKKIAERIRSSIEESENPFKKITVSIGLAEYDKENYQKAIENADDALYEAKHSGRNKIVSFDDLNK